MKLAKPGEELLEIFLGNAHASIFDLDSENVERVDEPSTDDDLTPLSEL